MVFKIIVCIALAVIVNGVAHESIHWYRGQKVGVDINDVCFFGLGRYPENNTLGSMAGWVTLETSSELTELESSYIHDENLPTVVGMISGLVSGVALMFMII